MFNFFYSFSIVLLSNFSTQNLLLTFLEACIILILLVFPSLGRKGLAEKRLKICRNGYNQLYIFIISSTAIFVTDIFFYFIFKQVFDLKKFIFHIVFTILIELILFISGILRVYIFSRQLSIKLKIIGVFVVFIPIVNLIVLLKMISIVKFEVKYENEKILLNSFRQSQEICKTKYPILLVHGVFFRDYKYFNYWGRIPDELKRNGATIYYGNHQSAASIKCSAEELSTRIKSIISETGCKKLNIIAHSKGGLDCKYLLNYLDMEQYIASITTINTPHNGCMFADYLFSKLPHNLLLGIAESYNKTLRNFGDTNPDFIAATKDLTSSACVEINKEIKNNNIFCQSIGSKINKGIIGGKFPLNYTYLLVKYFDGNNDGLVGEKSSRWGENHTFLTTNGKHGISHGDIIDLNRENLKDFDVREFYVQLVYDLKKRGL